MSLKLRPYQTEAITALRDGWADHSRIAVVLPTGMGKTVIFSDLVAQAVTVHEKRSLILVHRDELVKQAAQKIRSVNRSVSVGIVKAASDEHGADVVIASVQTLARASRRSRIDPGAFGLIIVDECHHAAAKSYRDVLEYFGAFRDRDATLTAGFTATMTRADNLGLGDVWEKVVYERDILYGIGEGYLSDVRGVEVTVDGLDLGEVARTRGDYQEGALGEALESCGAGAIIAAKYIEHAGSRSGVLFAPTVATARSMAGDFNDAGIKTEVVTGETPPDERDAIYRRFADGTTQVLSNCMVLTEGWDAPIAKVAVIARPTTSQSLYVQMAGRVLRPYPGEPEALILDVMGVSGKLQLATISDLSRTVVNVQPGETLIEAAQREADERRKAAGRTFKIEGDTVTSRVVDLFGTSKSAWLQTEGGTWFIPARDATFFLWPDDQETRPGMWKVGKAIAAWGGGRYYITSGGFILEDLTQEYAMAWAEQEAENYDSSIASRESSWRKKKAASASPAQVNFAAKLGIAGAQEMTKPELSDAISVKLASKILDVN